MLCLIVGKANPHIPVPRKSASIACGASIFEVCMKFPTWAAQVLRQFALDISYRSLVTLGIASIQGLTVAAFEKEDAKCLLYFIFFCTGQGKEPFVKDSVPCSLPGWFTPPAPNKKRPEQGQEIRLGILDENKEKALKTDQEDTKEIELAKNANMPLVPIRQKLKVAAMRPVPHVQQDKMLPFIGIIEANGYDASQAKSSLLSAPTKHNHVLTPPTMHRKSTSVSF